MLRAGRDQREVRRPVGAALLEHELGVGLQLVFLHARPGVAHRLHDAEAGDPRRLADDRDLARALDRAQRVDDRIEIGDRRSCGAAAFSFWTNCSSRETRPSQGSAFVARHSAAGSEEDASPRTSGRNGVKIARPSRAEAGDRRARTRRARTHLVDAGRRRRLGVPGDSAGPEHPLLAALVPRLQVQRRLFVRPSMATIARGSTTPVR